MDKYKELDKWTLLDIVKWGTAYFREKGIDSPRLTIELLLCKLLSIKRIDIYTHFEKPLLSGELKALKKMIKRRVKREPLQYILGEVNFCGLNIRIDPSVLIPRPETELLVNEVLNSYNKDDQISALDIGTGSGCIALALAKHFTDIKIDALDISSEALLIAKENAGRLGLNNIDFIQMNILNDYPSLEYDLVVSNPPYIPESEFKTLQIEVSQYEPKIALSDNADGTVFYERYAEIMNKILKPLGRFYLEIGFEQSEHIKKLFQPKGFKLEFLEDDSGKPRIVKGIRS